MNEAMIEQVIKEVLKNVSSGSSAPVSSSPSHSGLGVADYPLASKRPELVKTPTGKDLKSITLDGLIKDQITSADLRISAETLEMQAQIAEAAGRKPFARNLRRAAELTRIPDERVLEIYNALRPFRSTKPELLAIADELDNKYQAKTTAAMVREAADVYEKRDRLRKSSGGR